MEDFSSVRRFPRNAQVRNFSLAQVQWIPASACVLNVTALTACTIVSSLKCNRVGLVDHTYWFNLQPQFQIAWWKRSLFLVIALIAATDYVINPSCLHHADSNEALCLLYDIDTFIYIFAVSSLTTVS